MSATSPRRRGAEWNRWDVLILIGCIVSSFVSLGVVVRFSASFPALILYGAVLGLVLVLINFVLGICLDGCWHDLNPWNMSQNMFKPRDRFFILVTTVVFAAADLAVVWVLLHGGPVREAGNLIFFIGAPLVALAGACAGHWLWPHRKEGDRDHSPRFHLLTACIGVALGVAVPTFAVGITAYNESKNAFAHSKPGMLISLVPQTGIYLALGDSYAAGEGNPAFQDGSLGDGCHRSITASYPEFLDTAYRTYAYPRLYLWDVACSGAVTRFIYKPWDRQLSGVNYHIPPQVRRVPRRAVRLITITIGGNDLDFSKVITACLLNSSCMSQQFVPAKGGDRDDPKPMQLHRWLTASILEQGQDDVALFRRLKRDFPVARIVVVGYPYLLPLNGTGWSDLRHLDCTVIMARVPTSLREQVRSLQDEFNNEVYEAAVAAGVDFVSPQWIWRGHEPCGAKGQYNNALKPYFLTGDLWFGGSFHPNPAGQWALATLVSCYLHRYRSGLPDPYIGRHGPLRSPANLRIMSPSELGLVTAPGVDRITGCVHHGGSQPR